MSIELDLKSRANSDATAQSTVAETGELVFCLACAGEVPTDTDGNPLCEHGMAYVCVASESSVQSTPPEFGDPAICIPCGGSVATDVAGNRLCEH